MARFTGNIFGKARASVGGMTFLEARNRKGKIQTARERVDPANPQTPPQQQQRAKMTYVTRIFQQIDGLDIVPAFDRSVSRLPAYQSILSLYLNSITADGSQMEVTSLPSTIRRGISGTFSIFAIQNPSAEEYQVNLTIGSGIESELSTIYLVGIRHTIEVPADPLIYVSSSISSNTGSGAYFLDMGGISGTGIVIFAFAGPSTPVSTSQISQVVWGSLPPLI